MKARLLLNSSISSSTCTQILDFYLEQQTNKKAQLFFECRGLRLSTLVPCILVAMLFGPVLLGAAVVFYISRFLLKGPLHPSGPEAKGQDFPRFL